MRFTFEDAFHELLEMELRGMVGDEDSTLQMLMLYWGA